MDDGSSFSDEGGEGGGFMGMLQSMGMMNALRTGDVKTDMMVAMMIPILFRFGISMLGSIQKSLDPQWMMQLYRDKTYHQRRLRHTIGPNTISYNNEEEQRTNVLIKAIMLYVHFHCKIPLRDAMVELSSFSTDGSSDNDDDNDDYGNRGSSKKTAADVLQHFSVVKRPPEDVWHRVGYYGSPTKSSVDMEFSTDVNHEGSDDKNNNNNKVSPTRTMELKLLSAGPNAIDEFIATAHSWYMTMLRKKEDNSRYLYELDRIKEMGKDEEMNYYYGDQPPTGAFWKRYKLSDSKKFSTLFFQEKEQLLKLLNDFASKGGKYGIEGYPYKLGLLLHGPPGTGKTSLIKALAQYTGRSIINVPIAKVEKNSQLQSIFYDRRFRVTGQDVPIELDYPDVIYVMEDVDAASKVVHRRDGKKTADVLRSQTFDEPEPKCLFQLFLESNDGTCRELVQKLVEASERLKEYASQPHVIKEMCRKMMALPELSLVGHEDETAAKIGAQALEQVEPLLQLNETKDRFLASHAEPISSALDNGVEMDDDLVDMLLGKGKYGGAVLQRQVSYSTIGNKDGIYVKGGYDDSDSDDDDDKAKILKQTRKMFGGDDDDADDMFPTKFSKKLASSDKLSLSGLLNVLDGVVDSPGRILVMTSNHPEKLDPALIRPGRIDKKLKLGYMQTLDVQQMLSHYFQSPTLTSQQVERISKAINGNALQDRAKLELTPAQIEQLCAEHEELESMIAALEAKGGRGRRATTGGFGSGGSPRLLFAAKGKEDHGALTSLRFNA